MKSEYERTKYIIHKTVSSFDVVKAMGYPVNKYGRMNKCPICNHDGNGGFAANIIEHDRNGGYYCFYGQHGGDVIDLVMKCNGYSYKEAVNWLIRTFNLNLPEQSELSDSEQTALKKEQKDRQEKLAMYELLVKLYIKVMKDNRADLVSETDNLLENVIKMIRSIP